ncbi:MAG: chromosome segregation protein SMC [Chitinophagales bacterium]|nr:chromosome segregation protein SMC [Chitinophagales bacterium]
MQLTALEIKGFKSFAEKTTIHFNNRITGIVGPNGCGKSNVVDSIRWVLGEQKTSMLRLEKMENLIFNGTRQRKPAGLAEVSLTFENTKNVVSSDYKTITITRKLFRDGESEYRLNDVPCRLKDITGLFMDTGVSSDSYAIIELGMVDEILNDRDNSRRKLFEQAAGVSKYKKRKKETIEKLKSTDADLERVKDLLFEIENNLKTLEKQAQKTKKYYELKDEYKNLSLLLAKFSLRDYKFAYKHLEEDKQKQETAKTEIEAAIAKAEAALEKEKLDNIEKEKSLFAIQKQLNELLSGVSDKENERNLLNSQLKYARDKAETAQRSIIEANDQIEKLKLSVEKLQLEKDSENYLLEQKQAEVTTLEKELSEIRTQHNTLKDTLGNEQKLYAEKERQIFELDKKLAVNRSSNESLQRDLFQSEEDVVNKRKELEKLQQELNTLKQEKETAEQKLEQLRAEDEKNKKQLAELEQKVEKKRQELTAETRQLDAKRNEYELTKSLVENMEGFPEAIKFLKKNAKWGKNAPLLSDIIYCSEEHRIAIENFLEPYLSYYVVQNFEEALAAVNLLNDASKGKANFFILDDFEKYQPKQPVLIPGARAATELVELDAKYNKLGAFLLDRVYMLDDSKNFNTADLNTQEQKVVLLTKSGRFVRQDFSLSGGSVGLFEGKKIGRAKNLEKLQKEIATLEDKTRKLHTEVSELQTNVNNLKASPLPKEIDTQRNLVSQLSNRFSASQASIQSLVKFLESADAKSKSITERLELLRNEVSGINEQLTDLRSQQANMKTLLEQTDKNFVELTNKLSEASSRFNQKNIEFHQQQNRVNTIAQELNFKNSQVESLTTQLTRNNQVITECNQQIEASTTKLKAIESELLSGYSNKEGFEKEVADAEKTYYDSRATINDLDAALREENRKKEQINTLLSSINEKFTELKLNLTGLRERLNVEFNVNINDIINEEIESNFSKEELETDVQKMKKRIEGFGEINPMAVEAYDEMKTRYDFIITQRKDLEDAKTSLLNTIKEIEDSAKTQFTDAFDKVRESFIKVFRTLFSEEDQCDLFLVNPEDPLESKIEIIAKPKGKRPTVIDQLSGGEKTLTATALLFSLYLLKPAPFCIFDEVDAPLDDTNIAKFNKIIQEFSKDSQFIIVTHNKSTMSAVDAIYGVTMPEMGVSRVVPVSFSSLN